MGVAGSGHNYAVVNNVQAAKMHTRVTPRAASSKCFTDAATGCSKWVQREPLKQKLFQQHKAPRETTSGHRSSSKAKGFP